jgi:hypothetical protein
LFIPLLLGACLLLVTEDGRRSEDGDTPEDGRTPSLRRAALAGMLLGLAVLVRSTAALLPLVIPLWLLLRRPARESWRAAATMTAASVLVLAPWALRNAVVVHSFGLSTNGGYTIYQGANPHAKGPGDAYGKRWGIRSVATETHQNSTLLQKSASYVVHHPLDWLGLVPAKFHYLMIWKPGPLQNVLVGQRGNDPRYGGYERHLSGAEATLVKGSLNHLWLYKVWHYSYWVFGGIALVLATRKRLPGAGLALLLVGFWIVFHVTLVHGESRYMLSVTPLVAPALGWLLVRTARQLPALKDLPRSRSVGCRRRRLVDFLPTRDIRAERTPPR